MSNDLESPRTKSVRKRRVSERRHGEPPQEKKEPRVEKLIQAETAETGQVGAFQFLNIRYCSFSQACEVFKLEIKRLYSIALCLETGHLLVDLKLQVIYNVHEPTASFF